MFFLFKCYIFSFCKFCVYISILFFESPLSRYVGFPIAFTTYGETIISCPFIRICVLLMSTIYVSYTILWSFIDIASAPASFSSFTNSRKSSDQILWFLVSVSVITTPSPLTSFFPSKLLNCSSSFANTSDASVLLSIVCSYSAILHLPLLVFYLFLLFFV